MFLKAPITLRKDVVGVSLYRWKYSASSSSESSDHLLPPFCNRNIILLFFKCFFQMWLNKYEYILVGKQMLAVSPCPPCCQKLERVGPLPWRREGPTGTHFLVVWQDDRPGSSTFLEIDKILSVTSINFYVRY